MIKKLSGILVLVAFFITSFAQDFSKIKDQSPLKIGGGFNASATYYGTNNTTAQRDPFFWMLSANLVFNVYGISIPFSASISQQDRSFTQPFNQYGLSPKYKFITTHLGYRSLNFSSYTLSGLRFLGAGIEIKPEDFPFQFTALYGRFAKAVTGGIDGQISANPAYARFGYGTKVRVGKEAHNLELILFHMADKENSLEFTVADSNLNPKENLLLGFNTQHQLTEKIQWKLEYSMSAFTEDTRSPIAELSNYTYINNLGFLFSTRASSKFNNALNTTLGYAGDGFQLQLGYNRIDPDYRSLGTSYMTNNLENITASASTTLLKNRLNLGVSGGVQRNNLDQSMETTMKRIIGSLNAMYIFSPAFNVNLVYSNFSTRTIPVDPILLDSFNYIQITQNASSTFSYALGKNTKQNIVLMLSRQNAITNQTNGSESSSDLSVFNIANLAYKIQASKSLGIQSAIRYQNLDLGEFINSSWGPTLAVNQALLNNKLQIALSSTYLLSYMDGVQNSTVGNFQLGFNYKLFKGAGLQLNNSFISRKVKDNNTSTLATEYKGSIIFNYSF